MKRILASSLLLLLGVVIGYFIRDWSLPFSPLQGVSIMGTSGGTLDDFEKVNEELPTFLRSLEDGGYDIVDAQAMVVPARQGEYDLWVYVSPLSSIQPNEIEGKVTDFIDRRFGELMDLRSEQGDAPK